MAPKVLIGVPVKNCAQWVVTTAQQILNLTYPKELLTIAFVENDSEDNSYTVLRDNVLPCFSIPPYRAVHFEKHDSGIKLSHFKRHLPQYQPARYNALCNVRNFIVDSYLADNDYVCWIDADFQSIPKDMIERLVDFNVDLVAPIFVTPDNKIYGLGTKKLVDGVWLSADKIAARFPNEVKVEVDVLEPTLVSQRVFKSGVNPKGPIDNNTLEFQQRESLGFAEMGREKGFKLWLATKVTVIHADINGMVS